MEARHSSYETSTARPDDPGETTLVMPALATTIVGAPSVARTSSGPRGRGAGSVRSATRPTASTPVRSGRNALVDPVGRRGDRHPRP